MGCKKSTFCGSEPIVIMQRLHQNDLTGFLLESNLGFKHVRLPVIAEEDETWTWTDRIRQQTNTFTRITGELLHPARENMDIICDIRKAQGEFAFAGQYQQRPSPLEGGLVKEGWLYVYNALPDKLCEVIIACDTAAKTGTTNAYSAFVMLGVDRVGKKVYLLEAFRDRMAFPALTKKAIGLYHECKEKYKPYNGVFFLIEDESSGTQLIQYLQGISEYRYRVKIATPDSDKVTRFAGITPYIENGTVLFPAIAGPWWNDFRDELLSFPGCTYKDQCDAFAYGVKHAWNSAKIGPAKAIIF